MNGNVWVYLLGSRYAHPPIIKIGKTKNLRQRLKGVIAEQTTDLEFILLAAVVGTPTNESAAKTYFEEFRCRNMGSKQEYFRGESPLMEYAAWLRGQWWSATDENEELEGHAVVDPSSWLPDKGRRFLKPKDDPHVLIQVHATQKGCLPEPYSWFPNPKASFQDYFTPPEIVNLARDAMGGVDLDAASHWAANKVHKIPEYFDVARSAFQNDWHGNVWLNPPYGDYGPWFNRALYFIENGKVEQFCMISPVWAFTTQTAKAFMTRISAMVLLSPTPKFWGNADPNKTGNNNPHAIVYIGGNPERFLNSFSAIGIPMKLEVPDA